MNFTRIETRTRTIKAPTFEIEVEYRVGIIASPTFEIEIELED